MALTYTNPSGKQQYGNSATIPSFTSDADDLLLLMCNKKELSTVSTEHGTFTRIGSISGGIDLFAAIATSTTTSSIDITWSGNTVLIANIVKVQGADVSSLSAAIPQFETKEKYGSSVRTFSLSAFGASANQAFIFSTTDDTDFVEESGYTKTDMVGDISFAHSPSQDTSPTYEKTDFGFDYSIALEIAEATSTAITADGAITLPSLVFAGSATDSTSEITAAGDITLPSLVFAGSATDSTSEVTAAGDITLPSLVFAGNATDSTSEVTAAGDITLPSLVFAGSATDSTSEVTAAGDITLPSLVFAGNATDSTSEVTAAGDITLPSLVFAGTATDTTSEVTAAGDITLPSLVFAGSASTSEVGQVTAAGDITLPSLVFAGSATDTTSELTATGAITLPSLVFQGNASDSTSEVTAAGAITLPSLVFQGSATDSTSEVTVSGAITLPSLVFAGNATAGQVISDFTIQIDNTAKIIETTPNSFTIRI